MVRHWSPTTLQPERAWGRGRKGAKGPRLVPVEGKTGERCAGRAQAASSIPSKSAGSNTGHVVKSELQVKDAKFRNPKTPYL